MRSRSQQDGPLPASAGAPTSPADAATGVVALGVCPACIDALQCFMAAIERDSGLAFVVVLDRSIPDDDVRRLQARLPQVCALPVLAAVDGSPIAADRVYVAGGDDGVAIDGDRLRRIADTGATRAPIDFFMRSLAGQCGERSVGVLLSTHMADGSLGMRAIREAAGLTLIEAAAGGDQLAGHAPIADVAAAAAQLPARIVEHRRALARVDLPQSRGAGQRAALEQILLLLRAHTGHDFSSYKKTTLGRRIERRMGLHQLDCYSDYVDYLRENTRELSLLFKELLIGVTRFFRDPEAWQALQALLPSLLETMPAERPLRAWVAGCSTGEEAYTLAIALQEAIERLPRPPRRVQIFATDLDPDAIERARAGWFPAGIANDVEPARLQRFFVAERDGYRVARDIRERVVFAPHNVFMDPPFTRLDLLVCRNLLIYLEPELQRKLLPLFHFCLNADGVLLLGSAETVGRQSALFSAHDPRARLYRREADSERFGDLEFPARLLRGGEPSRSAAPNLQQHAEQLLLQRFAPAAVLVNSQGDVLYINGRTGRYLEPAAGRANWNIYAMARKGLGQELAIALPRALREKSRIDCPAIEVSGEGGSCRVDLGVYGIDEPDALHGLALVTFSEPRSDLASCREGQGSSAQGDLTHELQLAREAVRTTREEMQSQQEELRSANEELQSTNEEVQSANEELTTSKEEMQSLNEELQACNAELQAKLDELSRAESDLDNLFAVTDQAVLFLGPGVCVRRYTGHAGRIFKLVPADIGRCLGDFVSELDYPELPGDVDEVLRSLCGCDKQVPTRDNRRYRVRIRPYRTRDQTIDGVVLSLTEVGATADAGVDGRERR